MIGLSKKDAGTTSPAPVWDMDRAANARRINGGWAMTKRATKQRGTTFVPVTKFVPKKSADIIKLRPSDATPEFAMTLEGYSVGEVATAAGSTKEAAKSWMAGKRLPTLTYAINMARSIPTVRAWLYGEIDPSSVNALMAALHMASGQPGSEGDAARVLLRRLLEEIGK